MAADDTDERKTSEVQVQVPRARLKDVILIPSSLRVLRTTS